jgi:regulator of replication initiation timing
LSSIEDENVALKAENADLNKRLTSIEEENILLKTEDARLDKRLSSIDDGNHARQPLIQVGIFFFKYIQPSCNIIQLQLYIVIFKNKS